MPNPGQLSEQLADHLAAVDDLDRPAIGGQIFLVRVDRQHLAERDEQILHADGAIGDVYAVGVGGADHLSAAHAGAGQADQPALGSNVRGRRRS